MLPLLAALATAADPTLSGAYALADSAEAVAEVEARALETAVSSLPWALRPIARPLLRGTIQTCGELSLELAPEHFSAACDDRRTVRLPRAGEPHRFVGEDGGACATRVQVSEDAVEVTFDCARGGQRDRYRLVDGALEVTREVFSPQLKQPVQWTVRYRPRDP